MKPNDTVPDATAEHDTDPTSAQTDAPTDPGSPPDPEDVENLLDGFGGRPKSYFAKHQAGSNGRNAAKYDAVASPAKAHTDPSQIAPVILATTAEEPIGRILQEASREANLERTAPMARVSAAHAPDARRGQTTTPGLRSRRSLPTWLLPALVVVVIVAGAVLYLTRRPASEQAMPDGAAREAAPSLMPPPTPAVGVVEAHPASNVPAPSISSTMFAAPPTTAVPVAPAPLSPSFPSPSVASARPTRAGRTPEAAPGSSAAPAPSSSTPRGDMKWNFE